MAAGKNIEAKTVAETRIRLGRQMGHLDANTMGNVHGGVIMKECDEAGAMAAIRFAGKQVVTVTVDQMLFNAPIRLGELVYFEAEVTWAGRTSIETLVTVKAENLLTCEVRETNRAYFVYVAVDEQGKPSEVPELICETENEQRRFDHAIERRAFRLAMREREEEF